MSKEEEKQTISSENIKSGNIELTPDLIQLDLEKIRECIQILEEYRKKCVNEENFPKAKEALERINQFKKIEEEKMKIEAEKIYKNQKEIVEQKQNNELEIFNQKMDEAYKKLNKELNEQESNLLEKHQKELIDFKNFFELNYEKNKRPKPSSQLLNWIKIKEQSIKQKNYEKATLATKKIEELGKKDIEKFNLDKDKKLKSELQKLIKKQDNEMFAFKLKCKSIINSFNNQRKKELDSLNKKYHSRLMELGNYQKVEMSFFQKIKKGISKPNTRIQSIIKNALQDEEEEEEKEDDNNNNDNNAILDSENNINTDNNNNINNNDIHDNNVNVNNIMNDNANDNNYDYNNNDNQNNNNNIINEEEKNALAVDESEEDNENN